MHHPSCRCRNRRAPTAQRAVLVQADLDLDSGRKIELLVRDTKGTGGFFRYADTYLTNAPVRFAVSTISCVDTSISR